MLNSGRDSVHALPMNAKSNYYSAIITLKSIDVYKSLIEQGFFLQHLFMQPTKYIPKIKQCDKCLNFGHLRQKCKATDDKCLNCAGTHSVEQCKSSFLKCANCGESHKGNDRHCKKYMQVCNILNFKYGL